MTLLLAVIVIISAIVLMARRARDPWRGVREDDVTGCGGGGVHGRLVGLPPITLIRRLLVPLLFGAAVAMAVAVW